MAHPGVPWSQRFFLKFFFSLSPCHFAARSPFPKEKFQEKPLGPG